MAALLLCGAAAAAPGGPAPEAEVAAATGSHGSHGAVMATAPGPQTRAGPVGYLVVPLENQSQSAGLSWMSAALSATLAERLEFHPGLRPAYGARTLHGLPALGREPTDMAHVATRARQADAEYVFAGEFDRVDWRYRVGLRVYRAGAGAGLVEIARAEARSPVASGAGVVLDLLDEALFPLLDQAGLPVPAAQEAALRRRPTRDVYALTLFGRALLSYYGIGTPAAGPAELERVDKTLQRVCFIDPKFAEAHRMLGLIALDRGETARAMGQYAYVLDLRPDSFAALSGLAQLYAGSGNRVRALELIEKALRLRPWDTDTRLALCELLWEAGSLPEAQAELQRVVKERPDHVAAGRTLALVYAARGMNDQLAAELLHLQTLLPDDIEVQMDLGAVYQRMGRLDQALSTYQAVLQKRPRQVQALRQVGDLYRRRHEPERALPAYQRMVHLSPDDPRGYFLLGAAYQEAGQLDKAEQVLKDAVQFRHYVGEAWGRLGALALKRNELTRAQWYLSRAAGRSGARAAAHYNYGLLLERLDQPDRALAELHTAAELEPQDPDIPFVMGVIWLRHGDMDEAQRSFVEALSRQPDHALARHNAGLLHTLLSRREAEHPAADE